MLSSLQYCGYSQGKLESVHYSDVRRNVELYLEDFIKLHQVPQDYIAMRLKNSKRNEQNELVRIIVRP